MNTRKLVSQTLILMAAALATGKAAAEQIRDESLPVSPRLCRTLEDAARARFNEVWTRTWQRKGFGRLLDGAIRLLESITPEERALLERYRAGKADSFEVHSMMFPKLKLMRSSGPDGVETSAGFDGWSPLVLKLNLRYGFAPDVLFFPLNEPLDRVAIDNEIMRLFLSEIQAELEIPSPGYVHNADEYVRKHAGLPAACVAETTPSVAVTDADAGSAQSGPESGNAVPITNPAETGAAI